MNKLLYHCYFKFPDVFYVHILKSRYSLLPHHYTLHQSFRCTTDLQFPALHALYNLKAMPFFLPDRHLRSEACFSYSNDPFRSDNQILHNLFVVTDWHDGKHRNTYFTQLLNGTVVRTIANLFGTGRFGIDQKFVR